MIVCPICNGSGKIKDPFSKDVFEIRSEIAKKLKGKGYTVREIMKVFNYKSTSAVANLLKK